MNQPADVTLRPHGSTDHLTWQTHNAVATITINRPDQLNAFSLTMYDQFIALCHAIAADPTIRVTVLRGQGDRAFAAGTDISEFKTALSAPTEQRHDQVAHVEQRSADALTAFANIPQITVAAVNGIAAGAGFGLALAADLRVGVTGARVGFPIARTLGNVLSEDMTRSLVTVVGHSWAKRILLDAEMVLVDDLISCGAWSWACPATDFDDRLAAWTDRLVSLSAHTQAGSKAVLDALTDPSPAKSEVAAAWVERAYRSAGFADAVTAFTNKQPATFSPTWPTL